MSLGLFEINEEPGRLLALSSSAILNFNEQLVRVTQAGRLFMVSAYYMRVIVVGNGKDRTTTDPVNIRIIQSERDAICNEMICGQAKSTDSVLLKYPPMLIFSHEIRLRLESISKQSKNFAT